MQKESKTPGDCGLTTAVNRNGMRTTYGTRRVGCTTQNTGMGQ